MRSLYAALVHLHPPAFQQRYGAEMLSIFDHTPGSNRAALVTDAAVSLLVGHATLHALSLNPASVDSSEQRRTLAAYFNRMRVLSALDLNRDLILSPSEIANAPWALRSLDTNRDGALDASESGGRGSERPWGTDFMRFHPVLAALDTDHDGVVSAAEIANAPAALQRLDKNRDGLLTAEELLPARQP